MEGVLDLLFEAGGYVAGLGHVPGLSKLSNK
jgi:hypothetical protein